MQRYYQLTDRDAYYKTRGSIQHSALDTSRIFNGSGHPQCPPCHGRTVWVLLEKDAARGYGSRFIFSASEPKRRQSGAFHALKESVPKSKPNFREASVFRVNVAANQTLEPEPLALSTSFIAFIARDTISHNFWSRAISDQ